MREATLQKFHTLAAAVAAEPERTAQILRSQTVRAARAELVFHRQSRATRPIFTVAAAEELAMLVAVRAEPVAAETVAALGSMAPKIPAAAAVVLAVIMQVVPAREVRVDLQYGI
jgi:hypothetical protein